MKNVKPKEVLSEINRIEEDGTFYVPEGIEVISGDIKYPENLKKLVLPESVETIERMAFHECTSLEKVEGGKSKAIGAYAFSECSNLSSFHFVRGCEISNGAFSDCAFAQLSLEKSKIRGKAFAGCKMLKKIQLDRETQIEYDAFDDCESVEKFIYPDDEYDAICIKGLCLVIKHRYTNDDVEILEGMFVDRVNDSYTNIYVCIKDEIQETDIDLKNCIRKLNVKHGISNLYK